MAKSETIGSTDVLFPEDAYDDYHNPHRRHQGQRETDGHYSGDLQHIFKGEGWSGRHDYAVVPPLSKRRIKKGSTDLGRNVPHGEQTVHSTPPLVIPKNKSLNNSQTLDSCPRRGHSFSQSYQRNSFEALESPDCVRNSPERRYSLRELQSVPYAPHKQNSFSESNSQKAPRVPDRKYPPLHESEGDNSFEKPSCSIEDSANTSNSRSSLNGSIASHSSGSSHQNTIDKGIHPNFNNNNKENYANPYRKQKGNHIDPHRKDNYGNPYINKRDDYSDPYSSKKDNYADPYISKKDNYADPYANKKDNYADPYANKKDNYVDPYINKKHNYADPYIGRKDDQANSYRKRVSVPEEDFHWRRRTWSPSNQKAELLDSNMGIGSSFQKKSHKVYRSTDQLENHMGPVYEDISDHMQARCPPKITPISGKLSMSQDQVVLRPIAFKPVLPRPNSYVCTPTQSTGEESPSRPSSSKSANHDHGYKSTNHDDGYISQGSHSASIVSQVSVASLQMDNTERSVSFVNNDCNRSCDRPDSYNSSSVSRVSSNHVDGYIQTPSPSDSGVSELEIMLREKDAEILHLRETMEHNERVIFQVSEEKYHMWQLEMQDLSTDFTRRLKAQQQKTYKMEQAFMLQIYKLQQDKRKMQDDFQALGDAKDTFGEQLARISEDLKLAAVQRDEANTQLSEKTKDVTSLQNQLSDAKTQIEMSDKDFAVLKSQLSKTRGVVVSKEKLVKQLHEELNTTQELLKTVSVNSTPTTDTNTQTDSIIELPNLKGGRSKVADPDTSQLRQELESRNYEIKQQREQFERERQQWMEEKDKVIRYQKQLQLNYVQVMRKNKELELEVGRVGKRDIAVMKNGILGEESLC